MLCHEEMNEDDGNDTMSISSIESTICGDKTNNESEIEGDNEVNEEEKESMENVERNEVEDSVKKMMQESSSPHCVFRQVMNSHEFGERIIKVDGIIKIGRSIPKCKAMISNGFFDCKVLSRAHAIIWYEKNQFYLKDTKSSNGTFVNNIRLGKAMKDSEPYAIYSGDLIQFGIEVTENENGAIHPCILTKCILYHPKGIEALRIYTDDLILFNSINSTNNFNQNNNSQLINNNYKLINELTSPKLTNLWISINIMKQCEDEMNKKLEYVNEMMKLMESDTTSKWENLCEKNELILRINQLENQLKCLKKSKNYEENVEEYSRQLEKEQDKCKEFEKEKFIAYRSSVKFRSLFETEKMKNSAHENTIKDLNRLVTELNEQISNYMKLIDEIDERHNHLRKELYETRQQEQLNNEKFVKLTQDYELLKISTNELEDKLNEKDEKISELQNIVVKQEETIENNLKQFTIAADQDLSFEPNKPLDWSLSVSRDQGDSILNGQVSHQLKKNSDDISLSEIGDKMFIQNTNNNNNNKKEDNTSISYQEKSTEDIFFPSSSSSPSGQISPNNNGLNHDQYMNDDQMTTDGYQTAEEDQANQSDNEIDNQSIDNHKQTVDAK
ncbi:hypothetical protein SNEBB_003041 [Seison nebaliae]|nr:hypothetical protein SNEBB_003041 [Seison nebaliae]